MKLEVLSKNHDSLEELHNIIHDLDTHLNKDKSLTDAKVNDTGEPYNKEDYYKE